ncbi:MAG: hypothetical protein AW12_00840 [Candidatus Accumulibacter sp. BA-94]|nr:MAG: hypothetical protein AW12_00840 [Candidatus Accumulibacter sp. BA-94]
MAVSKCPTCSGVSFELKAAERINGARFPPNFVQCASCGAVVGVMEETSAADLVKRLAAKLGFKDIA